MLDAAGAVDDLTDAQLVEAVLNEVWAVKVAFCSREDFLLSQLVDRFEAKCGIKRDAETGEIVS